MLVTSWSFRCGCAYCICTGSSAYGVSRAVSRPFLLTMCSGRYQRADASFSVTGRLVTAPKPPAACRLAMFRGVPGHMPHGRVCAVPVNTGKTEVRRHLTYSSRTRSIRASLVCLPLIGPLQPLPVAIAWTLCYNATGAARETPGRATTAGTAKT
jgi:hypothetical protein